MVRQPHLTCVIADKADYRPDVYAGHSLPPAAREAVEMLQSAQTKALASHGL